MVLRKVRYDGAENAKERDAALDDDYLHTLDEITERLRKEKENG